MRNQRPGYCYVCLKLVQKGAGFAELHHGRFRVKHAPENCSGAPKPVTSNIRIICAAVRAPDGYLIRGHRHNDALRTMRGIPRYKDSVAPHGNDQGFITSEGKYVTRFQAYTLMQMAGIPSVLEGKDAFRGGECFSEDLY